jgi:ankyrin repeat protein
MKHSLYLSFLVALIFSGHLAAMENTTLEAPLPAQKFLFHQHVPSLLGLTLNTISCEQLEDDKIRNLNLWNYAVQFKKNPERTNPVEALKLSLAGKILTQEEYKETVVMALKKRTHDCLKHLLEYAELKQEILNDLLLKADYINADDSESDDSESDDISDVHAINLLLSYHAKGEFFDRWQHSPLHNAVVQGDKEKVKELATAKTVNESTLNCTPLELAAAYDQSDIVDILLPYASNENKNKSLYIAIVNKTEKVIEPLINGEADVECTFGRNNTTLCIHACSVSNTSALRSLLAHGADSNKKDRLGNTPLHHAINAGCIDAVNLLIQNGAKINAKDNDKNTPLFNAILQENYAIINLLRANGANLCEKDFTIPNVRFIDLHAHSALRGFHYSDVVNGDCYSYLEKRIKNETEMRMYLAKIVLEMFSDELDEYDKEVKKILNRTMLEEIEEMEAWNIRFAKEAIIRREQAERSRNSYCSIL